MTSRNQEMGEGKYVTWTKLLTILVGMTSGQFAFGFKVLQWHEQRPHNGALTHNEVNHQIQYVAEYLKQTRDEVSELRSIVDDIRYNQASKK